MFDAVLRLVSLIGCLAPLCCLHRAFLLALGVPGQWLRPVGVVSVECMLRQPT